MSEQESSSNEAQVNSQDNSNSSESKEQFVRREAYEEVSKDMHKFKNRLKDASARANELESQLKAIEEEKLKAKEEWETLYNQEREQRQKLEDSVRTEKENYLRSVKMAALKSELGGKVKDIYLNHARLDEIEFDENGTLSPESVQQVANKFREEHSILIPSSSNNQITNSAPKPGLTVEPKQRTLADMSYEEKALYLKSLRTK